MAKSENQLKNFIETTKKSFIRQSGFEVIIDVPRVLVADGTSTQKIKELVFKASSINTPSTQLTTADDYIEVNEYRKYAYDYQRGIVAISFYIDDRYDTVSVFENWKNEIFSPVTRSIAYYDDYVSSMKINVLRKDGTIAKKYEFKEVFPKAINEINYDWSQSQTSVVLVTFEYATYELLDSNESKSTRNGKKEQASKDISDLSKAISLDEISVSEENNELILLAGPGEDLPSLEELGTSALENIDLSDDGDLYETAVESIQDMENKIESGIDSVTGEMSQAIVDEIIMEELEESAHKTIHNAMISSTTVTDATVLSIKEAEPREALRNLSAGMSAATSTAGAAMKDAKTNFQSFENKIGNAIGTAAQTIKNFEDIRQNFDKKLITLANGFSTVEKLANGINTAKNIKNNLENISRLSKQIRAKNGFGAITAAKATISSITALGKSTSQMVNQVKTAGETIAVGVKTIDSIYNSTVAAKTSLTSAQKEKEKEEELKKLLEDEVNRIRQNRLNQTIPVTSPVVYESPPLSDIDASFLIELDVNNQNLLNSPTQQNIKDAANVLVEHFSNASTVNEAKTQSRNAYDPAGRRDDNFAIPDMTISGSIFVEDSNGNISFEG